MGKKVPSRLRTSDGDGRRGRDAVRRFAAPLIVLVGAFVYANSLGGPFIFDDHLSIAENTSIRDLSHITNVLHPPRQTPVAGRPLVNLSLAINYALGGMDSSGYHLWNIGVHIAAALALWGFLRRVFAGSMGPFAPADALALAVTVIWLVHPLNTEPVDYTTQRTESMAALFVLITLYAGARSWTAKREAVWEFVAVAACLCGAATKESVVVAPVLVLLADRAFKFPSWRSAFAARRRFYVALATSWMLVAVLAREAPFFAAAGFERHVPVSTYALNQPPLIMRYLRLSVWPVGLVLDYGFPRELTIASVLPSVIALATLAVGAAIGWIYRRAIGFWAIWFFLTLAPASSIVPIPTEVGAERRMYLPLVAVVVLAVTAARAALHWTPRRVVPVAAIAMVAGLLAVATARRNAEYRSPIRLWETSVDRWPTPRAHENLAIQLRDAGRHEEAIAHLRIAAPDLSDARHALGSALIETGRMREGIEQLSTFLRENPGAPATLQVREELGGAYYRIGDVPNAVAEFRAVADAAPDYARVHRNLAEILSTSGDADGATREFDTYLRRQPRDADARRQLIGVHLSSKRFAAAESEARALISLRPDDAQAHNLLGVALASQGRLDEAAREFGAAVRLRPDLREAQENLAHADAAVRSRSR